MSDKTGIEWTDHTFNPWWGCVRVSPACEHCYAETFAKRFGVEWGVKAERKMASEKVWAAPARWNRAAEKAGVRARVFCASMADVFEDRRDLDAARVRLFALIEATPWLDWQLLTKRPEAVMRLVPERWRHRLREIDMALLIYACAKSEAGLLSTHEHDEPNARRRYHRPPRCRRPRRSESRGWPLVL